MLKNYSVQTIPPTIVTTIRCIVAAVIMVSTILSAAAVDPDIVLADPAQEARAKALTQQLRCPTCVSQSVDSSNVGISRDLQLLVRERIIAGDSDREILDYVASRYGDFVLLRPRVGGANIALWALPLVLFLTAVSVLFIMRARATNAESTIAGLSADEKTMLDAMTRAKPQDHLQTKKVEDPNNKADQSTELG